MRIEHWKMYSTLPIAKFWRCGFADIDSGKMVRDFVEPEVVEVKEVEVVKPKFVPFEPVLFGMYGNWKVMTPPKVETLGNRTRRCVFIECQCEVKTLRKVAATTVEKHIRPQCMACGHIQRLKTRRANEAMRAAA